MSTIIDDTTTERTTATNHPTSRPPRLGDVVYRFTGRLGEMNPIGLFDDGIRFFNHFDGTIVDGPFAGGKISGPDFFVLRPSGVGEIHAPELIEYGEHRVALDVRGYLVGPDGITIPPLEAVLQPGFEFPDAEFRVTATANAATTSPDFEHLNKSVIVVEGTVNMGTGAMDVTARAVDPPGDA